MGLAYILQSYFKPVCHIDHISTSKSKANGHAESNQQLVNVSKGSAKNKDIDVKSDEQSQNSKLVFPKTLNIM